MTSIDLGTVMGLSDDDNEELLVSPVRDAEKSKMKTLNAGAIAPSFVPADLAAMLEDAEAKLEETKFSVLSEQTVNRSQSDNEDDDEDDDLEELEELGSPNNGEEAKISGGVLKSTSTIVRTVSSSVGDVEEEMRDLQLSGVAGQTMTTVTTTRKVKFDPSGSDVVVGSGSPLISPLAAMPFDLKFSPFPKTPGPPLVAARSVSSDGEATSGQEGALNSDLVSPCSDLIDGFSPSNPALRYATAEEARQEAMMGTTPERGEEAVSEEEQMTLITETEPVQETVVTVMTEVDESAFVPTPSSGTGELDESAFIPTSSVNDEDDMDDEMFFPNRESCMARAHKPQPPPQQPPQQPHTKPNAAAATTRRKSVSTDQTAVAPTSTATRPSEQTSSKPSSASKPRVSLSSGKTPSWRTRANIAFSLNAKKPLGQRDIGGNGSTLSTNGTDKLKAATTSTTTRAKFDKENLSNGPAKKGRPTVAPRATATATSRVGTGRSAVTTTGRKTTSVVTTVTTTKQPSTGADARTHERMEMVGRKPVTVPKGPKLATESVRERRTVPSTNKTPATTRAVPAQASVSRTAGQPKPAATVPRAPRLSTASRATRSRESVGSATETRVSRDARMKTEVTPQRPLTKPISPRLATSTVATRRDTSKGTAQREAESVTQFKARPIGRGVMTTAGGGGDHGVPKVPKKALTVPAPFRLMTEARGTSNHTDDHDMADVQGANESSKPFHARPVPDFSKGPSVVPRAAAQRPSTTPAPFKLRSGDRSRPAEVKERKPLTQVKPATRKDLTIPKPFNLSGSKDADTTLTKEGSTPTKERNQQFHARPMPDFSRPPRQTVGSGTKIRRPVTTPVPFKFHAAEPRSQDSTTATEGKVRATENESQFKARPMPNFSRPPSATQKKTPNSRQQLTTPEPFRLHTSQRPQESRSVSTEGELEHEFHARPMPDFSRPPSVSKQQITPTTRRVITTPEPFRLHTDSRSNDKPRPLSTEERMAAECRQFQARPAPQFSKPPIAPQQRTTTPQRQLTTPEPFKLSTDSRSQEKTRPLSSEEMFVAECKQFQARPAPNFSRPPVAPKPRSTPQRVLTTPEPFKLSTDARSQERSRPLSTEEMLAAECKRFQAKPAPDFSRPPQQRPNTSQVTTPEPFTLSTGVRSQERPRPMSSEELLVAECQQFRAKPAPKFPQPVFSEERKSVARRPLTTPEPFRFHTGDRAIDSKKVLTTEELEVMECEKQFRAKPPPTFFSMGPPLDKKPVSRRPLTTPEPFKFHTSERAHDDAKRLTTEELAASECEKQFHARPAPSFPTGASSDPQKFRSQRRLTTPEPFTFHSGNRRKTIQPNYEDGKLRVSDAGLLVAGSPMKGRGGSSRKAPTQPVPFTFRTAERTTRETRPDEDESAERRCLFPTEGQNHESSIASSPSRASKRQAEETAFHDQSEKRNKQNADGEMPGGVYPDSADLVDIPGQNFFVAERIRAGREEAQGLFNQDTAAFEEAHHVSHDVMADSPDEEGANKVETFYFGTADQGGGEDIESETNVVYYQPEVTEYAEQQEPTEVVDLPVPEISVGVTTTTEMHDEEAPCSNEESLQQDIAPVAPKRTTSQKKGLANAALRRMRLQLAFEAKERARAAAAAAAADEERRRSSDSFQATHEVVEVDEFEIQTTTRTITTGIESVEMGEVAPSI